MKNNKSFLGLFLVVLVLLPGCMHVPTYQRKPLRTANANCIYRGVENNVTVQVKRLNEPEVQYLFGSRSEKLKNQCEIMYLSVHNLSSSSYVFSPADIDLAMMPYQAVAQSMKTNSVGSIARVAISAGGGFASYWLMAMSILLAKGGSSSAIVPITAVCGIGLGVISVGTGLVFVGKTCKSMIMNRRIGNDLKEKTLHKKVIINFGEQYEGLIFVKSSDYTPQFSVTMHEKNNKKNSVTFDVDLRENEQKE